MKHFAPSILLLASVYVQICKSFVIKSMLKVSPLLVAVDNKNENENENTSMNNTKTTHMIFPGGGIFFYWQAGVITYLREQNYNLMNNDNQVQFTGASAGALCATLTCTDVNFESATELALSLAEDAGVWDRPLGLYGIWGDMIETWLDELLPENSVEMTEDKLSLLVTQIPSFAVDKISSFQNKNDLIRCNMASVHIPLFLNGKVVTDFRSKPHIDGSFIAKPEDFHSSMNQEGKSRCNSGEKVNLISLDWKKDPALRDRKLGDAVNALSKEGIWDLLEQGRSHAVKMDKRGDFDSLMRL